MDHNFQNQFMEQMRSKERYNLQVKQYEALKEIADASMIKARLAEDEARKAKNDALFSKIISVIAIVISIAAIVVPLILK